MARDDKGRFIKDSQQAIRTYKQDLIEMEKSAGRLEGIYKQLAQRAEEIEDLTEKTKNAFQDQIDIAGNLSKNKQNIFAFDLKGLDLADKIAQARKDGNKEEETLLTGLQEEITHQKKIQDAGKAQVKATKEKISNAQDFLNIIPGIGGSLSDALGKAGQVYEDTLGESLAEGPMEFKALGTAAKGAGLAIAAFIGKNLFESMQSMGTSLMDVLSRPEFIFFGTESRAIADEFGNMNESSMKLGLNMKLMSIFSGVSAENQAKIMGMMAATSDSSNEALMAQMKTYKQAGVPFRAIMDDVAGNTEFFAKFAKDGGANIFDAAKRAKELGVNLGDVASISESLLNFESSIEAQMNAQVLLGRSLNLDRARQLAFTGDQAAMMDEIVSQVGGEAEFNKLNVIQRKALADSVGLSVERMGALVRAEELGNEAAQKKFMSFVGIGSAVLGILGAIMAAIPGLGLKQLGQMAIGGVKGAAIGAGVGTAAYGVATAAPSFQTGEGEGKMVATTGVGLLHQGETVGRFNMDRTNELLERLVGETRNLGVSA